MGQLASQRRQTLEEAERVAERLDALYLDFAKRSKILEYVEFDYNEIFFRAAPFNNWMDGAREDLADMVIVHEMREV